MEGRYYSEGMLGGRIMFHHRVEDVMDDLFSEGQQVRVLVMPERIADTSKTMKERE